MKKMRTLLKRLGVFTLVMALLLTGCSRNAGEEENTSSDTETTEDTKRETTETPTTTEEERTEEPEIVFDENAYKFTFLGVTSKVGESEDAFSDIIPDVFKDGEWVGDWTGKTVWAYSFILEAVDPEVKWFGGVDIYNKATGEELTNLPGKSRLYEFKYCYAYDLETVQNSGSLYSTERKIYPFIFYIDEEIPLENLEFQIEPLYGNDHITLSINASIEDISLNYPIAQSPLVQIEDYIYVITNDTSYRGGVGPDGNGNAESIGYTVKNLSDPFREELFDISNVENLIFYDEETLKELGPITGCSPIWYIDRQELHLGYYSDTKLPDWSSEENPLLTTYPKITINGTDIIIIP